MSGVGGIPSSNQALVPSYAPLGKPSVGLESPENKDQTLPPVEEAGAGEKNRNQPHQKADATSFDKEGHADHRREPAAEQIDAESSQETLVSPVQDRSEVAQTAQIAGQVQLEVALLRAAALHAEENAASRGAVSGAAAVDNFNSNAGQTLAPGALLDQRS